VRVKNKVRQVMGEKLRPAWIERTYAAPEGLSPEEVEDIVWYVRLRLRRCAAASRIPQLTHPPTHRVCRGSCLSNRGYQKVDDTPYEQMELLSSTNTLHKGNIERVYSIPRPLFAAGAGVSGSCVCRGSWVVCVHLMG
jgi:hypothetical protein